MEHLRVPTVEIAVAILATDGRHEGRIFVPAAAAAHAGPTRPSEWLDDAATFLPFWPAGAEHPVLLAKASLAVLTVPAQAEAHDALAEGTLHAVEVVCAGVAWRGQVAFDRSRLLDFLNQADRFFVLRDGAHDHVVHKRHVTRVRETAEE